MADDQTQASGQQGSQDLVIPPELKEKHGELIGFIIASESMNNEERQYWINILPIMTPDQIQNLRGILENEKEQLKAIDNKYAKEIEQIGQEQLIRQTEQERRNRRNERLQKEQKSETAEEERTAALLKQIEAS